MLLPADRVCTSSDSVILIRLSWNAVYTIRDKLLVYISIAIIINLIIMPQRYADIIETLILCYYHNRLLFSANCWIVGAH